MKTVDVLRAARAKIEKPENWTTENLAKNQFGAVVPPHDPRATCWCTYGAIAASTEDISEESWALAALSRVIGTALIGQWNDRSTHEEILAALDKAIVDTEAAQS